MSEYKRLSAEECADRLLAIKKPLIICHVRPDGDTVGSGRALGEIFGMLGVRAEYICTDPIPRRLEFLLPADRLLTEADGDMTPIAIDVASVGQIGAIYDTLPSVALTIDHHAVSTPFSDYYTVSEASSAAEALMDITDVLIDRGLISLTPELAYALYAAISSDSGCFCFSNVSPRTHLRAAALIGTGIDFADINHRLFHSKEEGQLRAESFVGQRIRTAEDGRVAYALIALRDMTELGVGKECFESAIDIVRSLCGAEIAFTVKEASAGLYKVSIRSTDKSVSEIAAMFGGGGHHRAAGCSIRAASITEASDILLCEIKKLYK